MGITNRCSCPLRGRLEQRVQSGNSIQFWLDAAGQLNSMLYGAGAIQEARGLLMLGVIECKELPGAAKEAVCK